MKLQTALEVAKDCGLATVGEAIYNVKIHAGNLFSYSDIRKEIAELENAWNGQNLIEELLMENL